MLLVDRLFDDIHDLETYEDTFFPENPIKSSIGCPEYESLRANKYICLSEHKQRNLLLDVPLKVCVSSDSARNPSIKWSEKSDVCVSCSDSNDQMSVVTFRDSNPADASDRSTITNISSGFNLSDEECAFHKICRWRNFHFDTIVVSSDSDRAMWCWCEDEYEDDSSEYEDDTSDTEIPRLPFGYQLDAPLIDPYGFNNDNFGVPPPTTDNVNNEVDQNNQP